MKIATALRTTMANSMIAAMANGTTSNPKIQIYDGAMPSSMGQSITATLLAGLEATPNVATESGGVITFDAITQDSSADASGTAGWARLIDRDGAEVIYLSVSLSGGGGDLIMNTLDIAVGGPVAITSGTIQVGS
jgi:hypothetical protein